MKKIFTLFLILISLNSCKNINEKNIIEATRQNTEDYYFKNNYKINIIDHKLINYKELNSDQTDSIIKLLVEAKLINTAVKLSDRNVNDFYLMDVNSQISFIDDAGKALEYKEYVQNIKKNMGQNTYECHFYSKFITSDQSGNNESNHLYEDRVYLLNNKFQVLDILK